MRGIDLLIIKQCNFTTSELIIFLSGNCVCSVKIIAIALSLFSSVSSCILMFVVILFLLVFLFFLIISQHQYFALGSGQTIMLKTLLLNAGDIAFLPQLTLRFPNNIHYIKVLQSVSLHNV